MSTTAREAGVSPDGSLGDIQERFRRAATLRATFDSLAVDATLAPGWAADGSFLWYPFPVRPAPSRLTIVRLTEPIERVDLDLTPVQARLGTPGVTVLEARLGEHGTRVLLAANGQAWWWEPDTNELVADPAGNDPRLVYAPDRAKAMRLDAGNLVLVSYPSGEERPLTSDGAELSGYGFPMDSDGGGVDRLLSGVTEPGVLWSPDGRYLLTYQVDLSRIRPFHMVRSTQPGAVHQEPAAITLRRPFPGDEEVPRCRFVVFDTQAGTRQDVRLEPLIVDGAPVPWLAQWSSDATRLHLVLPERGFRSMTLVSVDPETGVARELLREASDHPLHMMFGLTGPEWQENPLPVKVSQDERLAVLLSDRDGWPHLYRVDLETGEQAQLTSGEWNVWSIRRLDTSRGTVTFVGGGREPGRDPYLEHLYEVDLAGGPPRLLTPEDADHQVSLSPDGRWLVDSYGRVDQPPVAVLRHDDGTVVAELERSDIAAMERFGWTPLERVRVLADDGETELWGTLYKPSDFDPARRYPIIDNIYAGPQIAIAAARFAAIRFGIAPSVAELGFVVLQLDARGTPRRSKAFQDVSYGVGFGSREIIADHVAAIQQLAEERSYIDPTRVGVFGASWGGYYAARCLLMFPEVFQASVALCGCHDNYVYNTSHELAFGFPSEDPDPYLVSSNIPLAGNLAGRLLLIHGELDGDTPAALTLQLAHALAEQGKDFDMLLLPERGHGLYRDRYAQYRTWRYFAEHLLGQVPPLHWVP
jgi:dipeptidyl aminopeptidase/acylaminoacyl peptidase